MSGIMLNVVLNVIMLNAIMLSVLAPQQGWRKAIIWLTLILLCPSSETHVLDVWAGIKENILRTSYDSYLDVCTLF